MFLRSLLVSLFVLLLPFGFCQAQIITDDFSDGDLLNPDYQGDTDSFVVENEQLRLLASVSGSSILSLSALTDTAQAVAYEIWTFLDFSPSSSNYASFFLSGTDASNQDISYELRVGGISGTDDALVFSRTANGATEELITGTTGAVGTDPVTVRIRLERSTDNVWTLLADYSGGTNFMANGSSNDPGGDQPILLNRFSIECNYTATRADKFFFDNLSIGPVIVDEAAPELLSTGLGTTDNQIVLTFNEIVSGSELSSTDNYSFSPGGGIDLQSVNAVANEVTLTLAQNVPTGQTITITVANLEDNFGNVASNLTGEIFVPVTFTPDEESIIITEFMADPTPEVGLPNSEYVEIYNRSDQIVRLDGLGVASGGAASTVENFNLEPGTYATIVRADNASLFPPEANVLTVSTLPALSNGGDEITLVYNGAVIQQINYDLSWYQDDDRNEGGYSLELADLTASDINCAGLWAASTATSGGTPGQVNSRDGQVLDNEGPELLSATFTTGGLRLFFSETLDITSVPGAISIEPNLEIIGILPDGTGDYFLSTALEPEVATIYTVTVEAELQDCAGNFSDTTYQVQLGLAEEVALGDVVINEVLFNPATGGSDFVELFNCSEKILNVNGWTLANAQAETGSPRERIEADRLLLPGGYLVFTENTSDILDRYEQAQQAFLVFNELPSLPNDFGNVSLIGPAGDTLDNYNYTEEQHSALLDDVNGVSLERVNSKADTDQDGNWFSAASRVGFATPTRLNSQARDGIMAPEQDGFFFLDEDTFSPDGDGFQDALFINYVTPGPGWNARLTIYDANGRLIRSLVRAELLAGEGSILWDGTTDDRQRSRTGIYVVLIERFSPDGETVNEKLVAVLVNQ